MACWPLSAVEGTGSCLCVVLGPGCVECRLSQCDAAQPSGPFACSPGPPRLARSVVGRGQAEKLCLVWSSPGAWSWWWAAEP